MVQPPGFFLSLPRIIFYHLCSAFSYSSKCWNSSTPFFSESIFFPWAIPSTPLVWIMMCMSMNHKYFIPSLLLISVLLNCENNYLQLNVPIIPKQSISIIKLKISPLPVCCSFSLSSVYGLHACQGLIEIMLPKLVCSLIFPITHEFFLIFHWKMFLNLSTYLHLYSTTFIPTISPSLWIYLLMTYI